MESIMYSAECFSLKISSFIKKIARSHSKKTKWIQVPKGCLPMYVGKEAKRYQVPVKYLSLPILQELIRKSQDAGLDAKIDGPIKLDCTPEIFDQTLSLACRSF